MRRESASRRGNSTKPLPLWTPPSPRGGPQAAALYAKGRQHSAEVLADFDKKIGEATDDAESGTLRVKRKLLANYADFPISQYKDQILSHLDE